MSLNIKNNIKYNKAITIALTGGSGAPYSIKLLGSLLKANVKVYGIISKAAKVVLKQELEIDLPENIQEVNIFFRKYFKITDNSQLTFYELDDWFSPVASGTAVPDAMVICPCSGGSLAAIAHGMSDNLIERAADVMLKEQKKLILVSREMPLSAIHLENMLKLAKLGVTIMPACPGFYYKPESVSDIVDFVVARILSSLGISQDLIPSWGN